MDLKFDKNYYSIEIFFALLRAGLFPAHGEEGRDNDSFPKDVDWELVYQFAREQSVQGLVLQGIDSLRNLRVGFDVAFPKNLLLQWIGEVQMIEKRNKAMNAFVADLIDKLRNLDIYAILVKGQGLAQCYERPFWRSCGDVDLLLSEDNYDKAKRFLIPLASEVEIEHKVFKHLGMSIFGWEVELHGCLQVGMPRRINHELKDIEIDTFYRGNIRSWLNGQTQVFMLGKENDIVYVFVHFLNHFYKEGVGLRQICDWCRLIWTYRNEIDENKIGRYIKKMGLISEWKAFGAFAVEYLGMPKRAMPYYSADVKWKKKTEKICAFILKTGNMGHNRDMSHFSNKPYLVRKCVSLCRRIGDLINHAYIFPLNSLRLFPIIVFNGVRSVMKGE